MHSLEGLSPTNKPQYTAFWQFLPQQVLRQK